MLLAQGQNRTWFVNFTTAEVLCKLAAGLAQNVMQIFHLALKPQILNQNLRGKNFHCGFNFFIFVPNLHNPLKNLRCEIKAKPIHILAQPNSPCSLIPNFSQTENGAHAVVLCDKITRNTGQLLSNSFLCCVQMVINSCLNSFRFRSNLLSSKASFHSKLG